MRIRFALISALALSVISISAADNRSQTVLPGAIAPSMQGAYTPAAGSPERKAILDAYRARWKQGGEIADVVFVVNDLKVHRGWAWLNVSPQSSNAGQQYEAEQGLLRKRGGRWRVLERTAGFTDAYIRKLKKKYPSVPSDIFPTT